MSVKLNTFDPTLTAIQRALEPRRYAPPPAVDFAVDNFRRQCERDAAVRDELAEREDEADRAMGGQSLERWSESEMGAE